MNDEIRVDRIEKSGLSKQVYVFKYDHGTLIYSSHWRVNRSSKKGKWADQIKQDIIGYEDFCVLHDLDEYSYVAGERYNKYRDKHNPVMQRTRQGRPKLGGQMGSLHHLPPCPQDVAQEAIILFIKFAQKIQVIYSQLAPAINATRNKRKVQHV